MIDTHSCIDKVRNYYQTAAANYGVSRMGVFGSVARGEQTDHSDVDIIYEGEADMLLRCRMKDELEHILGYPVDITRMRESLKGSLFYDNIKRDLIYV